MPTWLVTGANRGIGLAFAEALSLRGDRVLATARQSGPTWAARARP
ncbi:MAG TPA: hypothetical protein VKG01_15425 [Thermoanaerobaculia bacterium]|nr:hypothetical protein [Thermoanaerobaculia bacterium]